MCIPELESYFNAYMLPEIISPLHKPSNIVTHSFNKQELTYKRRMKISEHSTQKNICFATSVSEEGMVQSKI